MAGDQWTTAMCHDRAPEEECEEGRWDDDRFDPEQNLELFNSHASEDGLKDPVKEEAEKTGRCDVGAFG